MSKSQNTASIPTSNTQVPQAASTMALGALLRRGRAETIQKQVQPDVHRILGSFLTDIGGYDDILLSEDPLFSRFVANARSNRDQ